MISSFCRICRDASACLCLSVTTQLAVTSVQRPTPTVHLAGSFILGQLVTMLWPTERQRRKNVLTLVSLTPTVVLPSGIMLPILRLVQYAVGYTRENRVVNTVNLILTSYCLTSPERVSLRQVHVLFTSCIVGLRHFIVNSAKIIGYIFIKG